MTWADDTVDHGPVQASMSRGSGSDENSSTAALYPSRLINITELHGV